MWSSGSNTVLTVQTPGFYKISYMIDALGGSSAIPMSSIVLVITGANNPLGAGVSMPYCWGGYGSGGVAASYRVCTHSSGILPWYMYAGDTTSVYIKASSTGMTLSTSFSSFMCLELVSI